LLVLVLQSQYSLIVGAKVLVLLGEVLDLLVRGSGHIEGLLDLLERLGLSWIWRANALFYCFRRGGRS
jgi:hypothetical protein